MQPPEHIDRDILISRLLDARANDADWMLLREISAQDPGLWVEIAEARRLDSTLTAGVCKATATAELVDLVEPGARLAERRGASGRVAISPRFGWAVAAMLGIALIGMIFGTRPGSTNIAPLDGGHSAGLGGPLFSNQSDALAAYYDIGKRNGSVVGELPQRFVLDSKPAEGQPGAVEVTYVRQIIEKAIVKDFYKMGSDDAGRPVFLPTSAPSTQPTPEPKPSM